MPVRWLNVPGSVNPLAVHRQEIKHGQIHHQYYYQQHPFATSITQLAVDCNHGNHSLTVTVYFVSQFIISPQNRGNVSLGTRSSPVLHHNTYIHSRCIESDLSIAQLVVDCNHCRPLLLYFMLMIKKECCTTSRVPGASSQTSSPRRAPCVWRWRRDLMRTLCLGISLRPSLTPASGSSSSTRGR